MSSLTWRSSTLVWVWAGLAEVLNGEFKRRGGPCDEGRADHIETDVAEPPTAGSQQRKRPCKGAIRVLELAAEGHCQSR